MRRPTKSQQDFVSGTVGLTRKEEVQTSQFECLAERLGIPEDEWPQSPELKQFAQRNANTRYVPEHLLALWNINTVWDEVEHEPHALSDGAVIPPDIVPICDVEGSDYEPRTDAA